MMTVPAAVRGTFADLKFIRSRSVCQIVVEVPIEEGAAVVAAFGTPQPGAEVPVAVARLRPEAVKAEPAPKPERERKPWAELSRAQQAGIRCNEPAFEEFLKSEYPEAWRAKVGSAVAVVRALCQVDSRRALDDTVSNRESWDALDREYRAWLEAPRYGAA